MPASLSAYLCARPRKWRLSETTIPFPMSPEVLKAGKRELYVFYPDGQGQSKLQIPSAKAGTARNMNTVAKLADMAGALKA